MTGAVTGLEKTANKGAANGYAALNASGQVPSGQLPAAPVTSVAGRTGAITLSSADISGLAPSATTDTTNAGNITDGALPAAQLPASTKRNDGTVVNWQWNGQGGQPSWLWGSNDGVNMLVWNPSNFSVNYANSAGYASSAGSANSIPSTFGAVGTYVEAHCGSSLAPGGTTAGSNLSVYQTINSVTAAVSGTWQFMGGQASGQSGGLWLRIA
jgi:hypothetical protein